jgi:hypothetical protein
MRLDGNIIAYKQNLSANKMKMISKALINPTSYSIKARHDRSDDPIFHVTGQEQLRLEG